LASKAEKIQVKNTGNCIYNPVRPRLLSLKDAASYLGRGTDSLREMVYRRELRVIQEGKGKMWFDLRELDNWIDRNLHFA